ncbi:MAG: response regulator, partial [Ktedonobacterales bacterium]
ALAMVTTDVPDLVLLDVMMPGLDGIEVTRRLRADSRTSTLPIIMLTAKSMTADRVLGLTAGADDYIIKPFDTLELVARVRSTLRRNAEARAVSPLTSLPGNVRIEDEIAGRVASRQPFAVAYLDLDNFKAYNDVYGFLRGNDLIRLLAQVVRESVRDEGNLADFVGHIGGDDFVVITTPDRVDPLCRTLIARWEEESAAYYSADDQERGTFIAVDRQGQHQEYPLIGVSIGIVTNQHRPITTMEEVSTIAAEVKRKAKSVRGSSYYVDHRTGA